MKEIKKNLIYLPLFEIPFMDESLKKDLPVVDPIKVFQFINDVRSIINFLLTYNISYSIYNYRMDGAEIASANFSDEYVKLTSLLLDYPSKMQIIGFAPMRH